MKTLSDVIFEGFRNIVAIKLDYIGQELKHFFAG